MFNGGGWHVLCAGMHATCSNGGGGRRALYAGTAERQATRLNGGGCHALYVGTGTACLNSFVIELKEREFTIRILQSILQSFCDSLL